jgi:hypothetical protein
LCQPNGSVSGDFDERVMRLQGDVVAANTRCVGAAE